MTAPEKDRQADSLPLVPDKSHGHYWEGDVTLCGIKSAPVIGGHGSGGKLIPCRICMYLDDILVQLWESREEEDLVVWGGDDYSS